MSDLSQLGASGQTYSRWFMHYPSTHVDAGRTVEVLALPALQARLSDMDLHDDTGDPGDEGYMAAVNEIRKWLGWPNA